jgi:diguanylate cyclase (GGDEF)-like protein/PAS domain S-box-containing protein
LLQCEERLRNLIRLSSDFYWEQDAWQRFTLLLHRDMDMPEYDPRISLGKTLWDLAGAEPGDPAWEPYRRAQESRQAFVGFVHRFVHPMLGPRYVSVNGQPTFDAEGRFKGYCGTARDVTERVRFDRRMAIEHGVASLLTAVGGIEEATPRIIRSICEALGWACGARWVSESDGVLRRAETWGATPEFTRYVEAEEQLTLDTRHNGRAIARAWGGSEPVWVRDLRSCMGCSNVPSALAAGLRAAFALPIMRDGEALGGFEFFAREIDEPDAELLRGMAFVSGQIAQFLHRSRSEEQLRESEARYFSTVRLAAIGIAHVDSRGRFIHVNRRLCEMLGYEEAELLQRTVKDVSHPDDRDVTNSYRDQLRAGRIDSFKLEKRYLRKDGTPIWVGLTIACKRTPSGAPLYDISVVEDISARKAAEQRNQRLGRMYTALSATNEAMLRANSPEDLYERVCEAAVSGGNFLIAQALLADESGKMRTVALRGRDSELLAEAKSSGDESSRYGRGLVGTAFRTQKPCVSNDFLNDERTLPWHDAARAIGIASGAALPLIRNGRSLGALTVFTGELNAFDAEIVMLLERMVENVAYKLGNFEREAERTRAEQALRESEERFRSLTQLSSDWYWEQDPNLRFSRFECPRSADGWDGFIRRRLGRLGWGPEAGLEIEDAGGWDGFRRLLQAHQPYRDVVMFRTLSDGSRRYTSVSGEPMFDRDGRFAGYRGVGRDVTERKQADERIQYLATHDGLTGLPNRAMFSQLLNMTIETSRRYSRSFAVLFIDLDRFKLINDSLGHEAGDTLLKEMSGRLRSSLRASDVIARLGGDEFVVLLPEVEEVAEVAVVARSILSAALAPLTIAGHECRVTASIGICMYPRDATDEQSLMKNADIAMYLAKEEGKNNYQFYVDGTRSQSIERLRIETNLRRALERNEFSLQYQPKVDFKTGAISGVEALLRWNNPELGSVSPTQFIPIAEEVGLIVPIGKWVLRTACAQNVAWQREGLPPICMAVNLSARQFTDKDLLSDVAAILADTGMAPELLELEITEGMVIHDPERAIELLTAIKRMGVRLAIDDFGTGYSSLGQLKHFPIDTLKVDRSFIREVPNDTEDRAITEAIIAMGKTLSLTVVAEGVETTDQERFLREKDCDQMQGYYFSRPISPHEFAALLRTHQTTPTAQCVPAQGERRLAVVNSE